MHIIIITRCLITGDFWFTNLAMADPTYIFPVFNAVTFLLMVELGADGIEMEQKTMFKNVMRAMAVFMVPMTASMPAGLFVYWSASNTFSVVQTAVLKSKVMKKILKLPEPPKDAMLNIKSPFQNISEVRRWLSFCEVLHRSLTDSNAGKMLKKEMAVKDTATAEIVDGSRPTVVSAPPPPSTLSSTPPGRKPKAASSP
jgi:membrane protein insertase Oxa1/YidC/SpoIIIJ